MHFWYCSAIPKGIKSKYNQNVCLGQTSFFCKNSGFSPACPFRRLRRHLPRVRGRLTGFILSLFPIMWGWLAVCILSFHKQITGTDFLCPSFLYFRFGSLIFFDFSRPKSRICSFPVDISFLSVHNKEKIIMF